MILPADRAIEIVGVLESLPLSGGHYALELLVAVMPAVGINVAIASDAIEIIEIDVQDAVALGAAQSQFYHHLICDKIMGMLLDAVIEMNHSVRAPTAFYSFTVLQFL